MALSVGLAQAVKEWHDRDQVHGCVTPASVSCEGGALELLPLRAAGPSAYRAPELWLSAAPDFRSDIFSVGVICYEMISGSAPFRGKDDAALKRALLERSAEPLADAPFRLRKTIAACLEKRPERRLQRIGLLLTELRLHEIERRPATVEEPDPAPKRRAVVRPAPPSANTAAAETIRPAEASPLAAPEPYRETPPAVTSAAATFADDEEGTAPGYLNLLFNQPHRCPRCGSVDLQNSRPRNAMERNMVRVRVKLLRCQRCYSRFMRAGILRMEIDEAL